LKDKLKIGIIFSSKKSVGGSFRQELNAALSFYNHFSRDFILHFYSISGDKGNSDLQDVSIDLAQVRVSLPERVLYRSLIYISGVLYLKLVQFLLKNFGLERKLKKDGIDLVYFLSSSPIALGLSELNFITTVHDLCHLDHPEFPEVRNNGEFEARQKYLKTVIPKAVSVIVDSEIGKQNVIEHFSAAAARVVVMPFSSMFQGNKGNPEPKIDIREKYKIIGKYIFYPAQFWPHKNHVYILEALKILKGKFSINLSVVFSGGDKGNLDYIKRTTQKLGLSQSVQFLGFVDDADLKNLYKDSVALVMPSYFGPTNIPPLEAFSLKTPVIYPNEPGLRDQVGSAALLIDLGDPASLANQLKTLLETPRLREELIDRGVERLEELRDKNDLELFRTNLIRFHMKRRTFY
jgi:glycosyltransferase involved in cell wall biosynthesis